MKNVYQKLIMISFAIAIIAGGVIFVYLKSLQTSHIEIKDTTIILVASETIPPRTLIDEKMIKKVEVAHDDIFSGYINDASSIIGKYSKGIIIKDEGFHEEKLMVQKDVGLSLRLESNHRAVSIKVPDSGGVSHLIQPGDFVDILSFLPEKMGQSDVSRPDLSKLILQNIEILAIDKDLNYDVEPSTQEVPNHFLVTFSVPIDDLEKLYLAESIGSIKLALRPFKVQDTIDTNVNVWQNIISNNVINEEQYEEYRVKTGDNLKNISKKFYGTQEKYKVIKDFNGIHDENLIVVGQIIKLPVVN